METPEIIKKGFSNLTKVAATLGTLLVIGGAIAFYKTNIWKPTIKILNVDWAKAIATVQIGSKVKTLYGDQYLFVGGDYALAFNSTASRIELYKNRMVREILTSKS